MSARPFLIGLWCLLVMPWPAWAETANTEPGFIDHIVFCWLKEPGNRAHQDRLIEVSQELLAIPGVLAIRAGTSVPSDRSIVDDSFDVGIVMRFASVADMQAYLVHPKHRQAVVEVIKPLTERILVFDIDSTRR